MDHNINYIANSLQLKGNF